jgi:hypothetical protein
MFCGRAGHLNEFCFCCKRIEKRRFDYGRNSYRDEFSYFLLLSFSRGLPRTSSRALSCFSHGPNHRSYGFGSQENNFVPRCFGYSLRPHHGDRFFCRPSFPAGGSRTHPEHRHLDGPHFLHHDSRPTWLNGEVQRTMKISSCRMVKCSLTSTLSHRLLLILCRCWTEAWRTSDSWTPVAHDTWPVIKNGSPTSLPCYTRSM